MPGERTADRPDPLGTAPIEPGPSAPGAVGPGPVLSDWLRLGCAWALCGILFFGWCLIAGVLRPLLVPATQRRIGRGVMHRCFGFVLRAFARLGVMHVDARDLARLAGERGLILAPNHPTMLDAMVLIARLENVNCIMKADLWDNPFLGAGARLAGFIRNDSPRGMVRLAVEDLARGSRLLIFPEATRTVRTPVNPLHGGFALIAKKSGAPVQTILIETDTPYLRKGWPLFRRPPLPIRIRIRLGRRFVADDDTERLVAAVAEHYREALGERGPLDAQPPGSGA